MKRTSAVDVKIQAVSPLSTDANAREGAHNAPMKAAAPRAKLDIKIPIFSRSQKQQLV
jgi:hypothetical protein